MTDIANWVNAAAASFAAVASIAAAFTAHSAYKYQQHLEKNRHEFTKLQVTLNHFHKLMDTFAEISAISEADWSDERTKQLHNHAVSLRQTITVIGSLHPESGNRLHAWRTEHDPNGVGMSQVVDYILGQQGAIVGDKYNYFFRFKSRELRSIQDALFREFSA